MKKRVGLGIGVACVGLAGLAGAQATGRVALRWSAPAGCPSREAVTAEVDRLLGGSAARPAERIQASATVSLDPDGGFRVRFETPSDGGSRTREVKGASCAAVADATAMIIALMIDPTAAVSAPPRPENARPSAAGSTPTPAPPPAAAVPTPVPVAPPARPPAAERKTASSPPGSALRLAFRVSAAALADAGSLPGVSIGVSGAASVLVGPYRLELGAAAWPDHTAPLSGRASAGGRVGLVVGFASACRDILPLFTSTPHFELFPCAAFEVGRLHATGFGVQAPVEGAALWSAARAGALLVWAPIPRLGVDLRLDAGVPFARPSFTIEGEGTVHRAAPVVGRASLGAEVRF